MQPLLSLAHSWGSCVQSWYVASGTALCMLVLGLGCLLYGLISVYACVSAVDFLVTVGVVVAVVLVALCV